MGEITAEISGKSEQYLQTGIGEGFGTEKYGPKKLFYLFHVPRVCKGIVL